MLCAHVKASTRINQPAGPARRCSAAILLARAVAHTAYPESLCSQLELCRLSYTRTRSARHAMLAVQNTIFSGPRVIFIKAARLGPQQHRC